MAPFYAVIYDYKAEIKEYQYIITMDIAPIQASGAHPEQMIRS